MVFGDIFLFLVVLLIIYYAVAIAMDLFIKPASAENAKENEETEIDITEEAAGFSPTEIKRDMKAPKPNAPRTAEPPKVRRPLMTHGMPVEKLVAQVQNLSRTDDPELEGLGAIVARCEKAA